MCNLYSMTRAREAASACSTCRRTQPSPLNTCRRSSPAIVRQAEDGERELVTASWGFVLLQEERAPRRVVARRQGADLKSSWRPSFEARRCLVPASAYQGGTPVNISRRIAAPVCVRPSPMF